MDTNKLDGLSMDLENTNMEKLKSVFPECFSEGKLDIDKLLSLCGEYIDNDFEKYKFEWKGKSECLRLAQKRSTGTLRPCKEKSVNFDDTQNVYIEGDNLEVLKLLQTAYFNKIKMIYIDPPYNTGNDFVYEDDFADPMARYKEVTQQTTKSNPETMGRYHTNWLNMMYPRLRLAANLLKEDGVIFISIDDNEVFNLKKVCDEVFGEENFVGTVIIKSNPRGSMSVSQLAQQHEYLVIYAKNIISSNIIGHELSEDMTSEYKYEDEKGKYRLLGLRQRGGFWRRSERPLLYYPIYVNTSNGELSLNQDENFTYKVVPYQPSSGEDGTWRWSKEKFENEKCDLIGKAIKRNGKDDWDIFQKDYIGKNGTEIRRTKAKSLWDDKELNYQNGTIEIKNLFESGNVFPFPKPTSVIGKALSMIGFEENDIILDFFSGSATTAHAVMQLNAEDGGKRKFICVQLPELCDEKSEAYKAGYKTIYEIGEERIRRAGMEIMRRVTSGVGNLKGEGWGCGMPSSENEWSYAIKNIIDVGFKVFRLDTSNLKIWDSTPITGDNQLEMFTERMNSMIDSIKDDRTDMDVIYEIMLKMGVPLDTAVQYIEIDGKIVYIVGDFLLMIALYNDITAEDIDAMAAYAPAKIVCAEQGFKDDTALSNAHYILRDKQIELKLV